MSWNCCILSFTIIAFLLNSNSFTDALLRPQDSENRETKSLDGIWQFRLSPSLDPDLGFREHWYENGIDYEISSPDDVGPMPVPSSYNDISVKSGVRDFVGWAWYEREFFVPLRWKIDKLEVSVRFGSVHFTAMVWVNGQPVGNHSGGHLPFEMEVTEELNFSEVNIITVAVNNTLTRHTLPQGNFVWYNDTQSYPPGFFELTYDFDFFNYAGIHRPVVLYTRPKNIKIEDITVTTDLAKDLQTATVNVEVIYSVGKSGQDQVQCVIELFEEGREGSMVSEMASCSGVLEVSQPNPWWPYLTPDERPGYLYNLVVKIFHIEYGQDTYRLPIGIRSISWSSTNFQINHKDFYFRGFGRHEDSDIRGKGLDLPLVSRDFELIKWIGANSFRTSHYPYAEEIMDFADKMGIVVIDETPGVALDGFGSQLLANHLKVMEELIDRDKNRPSVVMWSLANEPKSQKPEAKDYFSAVANHTRKLDPTRPITIVISQAVAQDEAGFSADIISINRYFGWYEDTGHTELITYQMMKELEAWKNKYKKAIIVSEYGADTVAGLHSLPSFVFSEEYQYDLIQNTVAAFHNQSFGVIGEMIWNFADFMTKQTVTRVVGNRKGIFTRQRQPKASAHLLRKRYLSLAQGTSDVQNSQPTYTFF